ncbi:MAG: hypothetical protein H6765_06240 [Candidatus Peribacteria bacterium]|nr:MAG: hypothetical protein H6765_06240 [Candidatus Peribacteria bacterium]
MHTLDDLTHIIKTPGEFKKFMQHFDSAEQAKILEALGSSAKDMAAFEKL